MLNTITIRGGKPLDGEVAVRGAKNSVSKCMVAALLTDEECVLHNVAEIEDVGVVSGMIETLGGRVINDDSGTVRINCANLRPADYDKLDEFSGRSRIPVLFCGPVLARFGKFEMPGLGGCKIGPRPINYHLNALRKMGASVVKSKCSIKLSAKRLKGAVIELPYPSVGATEQVLLSAVLADGVTVLRGAAIEPEIMDLVSVLQKMGGIISVDAGRTISVTGVKKLRGYEHAVMPDRLESASWAAAAIATGGDIFVRNARQQDLIEFLNKYREIGGEFKVGEDGIRFFRARGVIKPINIETAVHPGFMTDWQQTFVVVLTQADGVSIVHETVYENRFGYVEALNKMGAKIELSSECLVGGNTCRFGGGGHLHSATIHGPTKLHGSEITVPDLRGGFSYIVAALCADGISKISNIGVIYRGYEKFVEKLRALGADLVE
ncbi:UDP-N-acetylglucosamine 1-carboxyvinyltransferase [Candidatus Uhrbacteria bacterium]|nr:UDP-N-acetylglucosamine 1-carboxyvinyltransferase [Candidatus Uhrbacteria bacterium]